MTSTASWGIPPHGGGVCQFRRFFAAGRSRPWLGLCFGFLCSLQAVAAPAVWLDWDGNPMDPPTVVAKWSIFEVEGGIQNDYTGFEVSAIIGSLHATANYTAAYPVSDGGSVYCLWSNSGNWDSLWIDFLHTQRTYNYLNDPLGFVTELPAALYGKESTLSELAIAGPTESNISIGVEDLPFIPDNVSASVGTMIRFNVNIDDPTPLVLNQYAELLHLHIGASGHLRNPSTWYLNAARGLDNAGRIDGAVRAWGGVTNQGTISGDYLLLVGGVDNSGTISGSGSIAGGLNNSGTISGYGSIEGSVLNNGVIQAPAGEMLIDTPSITGGGQLLCLENGAFRIWNSAGARPYLGQDVDSDGQLNFEEGWTAGPGVEVYASGVLSGKVTGETIVKPGKGLYLAADVEAGGHMVVEGNGTHVHQRLMVRPGGVADVRDGARWYSTAPWMYYQGNEGLLRFANQSSLVLTFEDFWRTLSYANSGTIDLDYSDFEFQGIYLYGAGGVVNVRNGSRLIQPDIRIVTGNDGQPALQTVWIDATSSALASGPGTFWLQGNVTNDGLIDVAGELYLGGHVRNNALIDVRSGALSVQGTLVNNGLIRMAAGAGATIDAPALEGAGSVVSEEAITLNHSADPSAPFRIAQPVTVRGGVLSSNELQVEPGTPLEVSRYLYSLGLRGEAHVIDGTLLRVVGPVRSDGRIVANAPGSHVIMGFDNAGELLISNGAGLSTHEGGCSNAGRIAVSNATFLLQVEKPWPGPYATEFPNSGEIDLDAGRLEFSSFNLRKYIANTGVISLRNGSVLVNPEIYGGTVTIDATSSVGSGASFSQHLVGNVTNDGLIDVFGTLQVGGGFLNRGVIRFREYGEIVGGFVNDGTVTTDPFGGIRIDAERYSGSGTTLVQGGGLTLDHSADPSQPIHLEQSITSTSNTRADRGFTTAPGVSLDAAGQFYGLAGGRMNVLTGQLLRAISARIQPGGSVAVTGTGTVFLTQSGTINEGQVTVYGGAALVVRYGDSINQGVLRMEGGELSVSRDPWPEHARLVNEGTVDVIGGKVTFADGSISGGGSLRVMNSAALYNPVIESAQSVFVDGTSILSVDSSAARVAGTVTTLGEVAVRASTLTAGNWHLGTANTGSFTMTDSTLTLLGDWHIGIRDPALFRIENSVIQVSGGSGADPNLLEVGGIDFGTDPAGWAGNFSVPNLTVLPNSWVRLVDLVENADPAPESLYVDHLVLEPGAYLIAQPNQLYYRTLSGDPAQIIPEPSALWLVAVGVAAVLWRRLRR